MPVAAKRLAPQLAFADLLRIEALLQHVVENTVEYSKAVWQGLTAEERTILLERFTIGVPTGGVGDATDEGAAAQLASRTRCCTSSATRRSCRSSSRRASRYTLGPVINIFEIFSTTKTKSVNAGE